MTMPADAQVTYGSAFTNATLNVTAVGAGKLQMELTTIGL